MPTRDEPPQKSAPVDTFRGMVILVFGVFASCTFDYSESRVEADQTETLPQVEVVNVRTVVERDNRLELTAAWMATYREERVQRLQDIQFTEYGPTGDIRVEGYAEHAEMDLDTEDVELTGTVRFYSRTEEASLESSYLFWDNADRVLLGLPDGTVTILRDDGSWVEGRGLRVDGRRNSVELSGGLEGEFVTDRASDSAAPDSGEGTR